MNARRMWIVLTRLMMALDNREFMEGTLAKECTIYGQRHGITEAEVESLLDMKLRDIVAKIQAAPLGDTDLRLFKDNP